MQEAANMILSVLPVLEDMVPPTKETAHLLGLFRTMLEDPKALEDEAYFLEHGKPRDVAHLSLEDLFAPLPDAPVPGSISVMQEDQGEVEWIDRPELLDRDDLVAYPG